jgi:hypothetical protein
MPKYASLLQTNSNIKLKDITSLQELPRIFVNVTKAIGMFIDIWLGKDTDPSCLYSPKPSNNSNVTINDNLPSTPTNHLSSRPTAQSLRGVPSVLHQQPAMPGTLKSTRSQLDNRKSISQNLSPTTPLLISTASPLNRIEKFSRINRPTVNSLLHLYGPWILDCCLLQVKDRYLRSSNDCK